jgi:3'-5' exoribonuclease
MSQELVNAKAFDYLYKEAETLPNFLQVLCKKVIMDERFQQGFGAHERHHNYVGGLIVHTSEVLKYSIAMAIDPKVNLFVLKTAAIVHDYFKIFDYEFREGKIVNTDYKKKIRHLVGSHAWFYHMAVMAGKEETPWVLDIEHCLISHHGRPEWGAAREPQTIEAQILHFADMMSASYGENKAEIK